MRFLHAFRYAFVKNHWYYSCFGLDIICSISFRIYLSSGLFYISWFTWSMFSVVNQILTHINIEEMIEILVHANKMSCINYIRKYQYWLQNLVPYYFRGDKIPVAMPQGCSTKNHTMSVYIINTKKRCYSDG